MAQLTRVAAPVDTVMSPNMYHPWYALAMTETAPAAPATETAEITISDSSHPDTHAHIAMTIPNARGARPYFALLPSEAHVTGWITRATEVAHRYGMTITVTDTRGN